MFISFKASTSKAVCARLLGCEDQGLQPVVRGQHNENMSYSILGNVYCVPGDGFIYAIKSLLRIDTDVFYVSKYAFNGEIFLEQPQALISLDVQTRNK